MPFFSGFAQGMHDALEKDRQLSAQRDEANAQRENATLMHLSTSPDPDIASAALTGLVSQTTGKRSKGLAGFFNETQKNPAFPTIRNLISQGRPMAGNTPAAASSGTEAGTGTTPGEPGSAALPSRSLVSPVAGPPSAAGPAPTATVPRKVFLTPVEQARAEEEAKVQGGIEGKLSGLRGAKNPLEQRVVGGAAFAPKQLPGTASREEILANEPDALMENGQRVSDLPPKSYLRTTQLPDLTNRYRTTDAPTALQTTPGRPASLRVQEAKDLQAAAAAKGETLSDTDALQQAETNAAGRLGQQDTLLNTRINAAKDTAIAQYQKRTGTTPASKVQAIAAARAMLGTNPDVTVGNVDDLANRIYQAGTFGGRSAVPPPGAPVPGGTTPPPSGSTTAPRANGGVAGAIPPDQAAQARTPKFYSSAGKSTVMAVSTMEPLLDQLTEAIKAEGLQTDNSPIGEGWNNLLYKHGIDPGQLEEQRLQLAGMSQAYGAKGLLAGRSNIPLLNIINQHLVQPGDSPQLILRKTQQLKESFPTILSAVAKSENMRVGGHGGQGGATTPPPTGAHPEGTRGTVNGTSAIWETRNGKSGWWPVAGAKP